MENICKQQHAPGSPRNRLIPVLAHQFVAFFKSRHFRHFPIRSDNQTDDDLTAVFDAKQFLPAWLSQQLLVMDASHRARRVSHGL
jgi:hypothetical protein